MATEPMNPAIVRAERAQNKTGLDDAEIERRRQAAFQAKLGRSPSGQTPLGAAGVPVAGAQVMQTRNPSTGRMGQAIGNDIQIERRSGVIGHGALEHQKPKSITQLPNGGYEWRYADGRVEQRDQRGQPLATAGHPLPQAPANAALDRFQRVQQNPMAGAMGARQAFHDKLGADPEFAQLHNRVKMIESTAATRGFMGSAERGLVLRAQQQMDAIAARVRQETGFDEHRQREFDTQVQRTIAQSQGDTQQALVKPGEVVLPQHEAVAGVKAGAIPAERLKVRPQVAFDAASGRPIHMAGGGAVPDANDEKNVALAKNIKSLREQGVDATVGGGSYNPAAGEYGTQGVKSAGGAQTSSEGQKPVVGPVEQGPADEEKKPLSTNLADIMKEIEGALGSAPSFDEKALERARGAAVVAAENVRRGKEQELGSAAAATGLTAGGLASISGELAAESAASITQAFTKLEMDKMTADREDWFKKLDAVRDIQAKRVEQEFKGSESEKQRLHEMARDEAKFAADREALDKDIAAAKAEGDADRVNALVLQRNTLDQSEKESLRAHDIDLQKLGLSREQFEEQKRSTLVSEGFTAEDLGIKKKQLDEFIRQFGLTLGLDEKKLAEMGRQFDATFSGVMEGPGGEKIVGFDRERWEKEFPEGQRQFNLDLMERAREANLDDATKNRIADLQDRLARDINRETIDPTTWESILGTIGDIGVILGPDTTKAILGEAWDFLKGKTGPKLGPELVDDGTGNFVPKDGATGGTGGISANTVKDVAVGATAAISLIDTFNDPKGLSRTAQAVASGAALGSVLPGVGTVAGAIAGAVVGGLSSAFGPSGRTLSQDEFTKQFDAAYNKLQAGGALSQDPNDPESLIQPQNRLALALAFKGAFAEYAKPGVSQIEISGPDLERMGRLGLVAQIQGTRGGVNAFLVDDPRVLALAGGGDITKYLDIVVDDKMVPRTHEQTGGSLANLIQGGAVRITDKRTGKVIDLNNPEQLKEMIAANSPTPPKQAAGTTLGNEMNPGGAVDPYAQPLVNGMTQDQFMDQLNAKYGGA